MLELFTGMQEGLFQEGAHLIQVTLLAVVTGLLAQALIDTGTRARGMPLLCGLAGVFAGNALAGAIGWNPPPYVANHGVLPAVLGTLAVATFVKLIALGIAGPQR